MYVRTARKVRTTYSLGTFWCYGTVQISFADGTFVSASVTFKKEMAAKGGGGGWRLPRGGGKGVHLNLSWLPGRGLWGKQSHLPL